MQPSLPLSCINEAGTLFQLMHIAFCKGVVFLWEMAVSKPSWPVRICITVSTKRKYTLAKDTTTENPG